MAVITPEQRAELERRGWQFFEKHPLHRNGKWFKMRTNGNVVLSTASVTWSETTDGRWQGWHGSGDAALIAEFMSIVEGYRLVPQEVAKEYVAAYDSIEDEPFAYAKRMTMTERAMYKAIASALSPKMEQEVDERC